MDWDVAIGLAVAIGLVVAARLTRGWLRRRRIEGLAERARPGAFQYLDNLYSEQLQEKGSPRRVVEIVEDLMEICDQNIDVVMNLYAKWHDERRVAKEAAGDKAGTQLMDSLLLTVALNGMGNLFGMTPETAPSFDPELALEGMSRGWRPSGAVTPSRGPFSS